MYTKNTSTMEIDTYSLACPEDIAPLYKRMEKSLRGLRSLLDQVAQRAHGADMANEPEDVEDCDSVFDQMFGQYVRMAGLPQATEIIPKVSTEIIEARVA